MFRANIAAAGVVALSWIAVAHFYRHEADADPVMVRRMLSALGLWFTACGMWTYARAKTPVSHLFLWYCALSGVHWGGPIGIGPGQVQSMELALFIVFGTVAPQAVFLDLARGAAAFPSGRRIKWRWAPYLPVLTGSALLPVTLLQPANDSWLALIRLHLTLGILLSVAGGLIWIARPFSAKEDRLGYAVVAASILLGWAPHSLATAGLIGVKGYEGVFNLPLAAVPLALSWYIGVHSHGHSRARG